jgi:hypothetical protein
MVSTLIETVDMSGLRLTLPTPTTVIVRGIPGECAWFRSATGEAQRRGDVKTCIRAVDQRESEIHFLTTGQCSWYLQDSLEPDAGRCAREGNSRGDLRPRSGRGLYRCARDKEHGQ